VPVRTEQTRRGEVNDDRPEEITPNWKHRTDDDIVRFASAQVDLPHPIALPPDTPTCLFLNTYRDDDGYRWSCYYKVNEGEIEWGSSADLE
jgi:hypothetical protein